MKGLHVGVNGANAFVRIYMIHDNLGVPFGWSIELCLTCYLADSMEKSFGVWVFGLGIPLSVFTIYISAMILD